MNRIPSITTVSEYSGESSVVVYATQLETGYSRSQAARVVAEWTEFFAAGPSPIRHLEFVSRTPRRLFESLRSQVQLESLTVKWGDYADLDVLAGMKDLTTLALGGASCVTDLAPLSTLVPVTDLVLEGITRVHDLGPIGALTGLTSLEIGGNWMSSKNAQVASIGFLRQLRRLRTLLIHTTVVEDRDYTPVLDLPELTSVRVMQTRGMQPPFDELQHLTPWNG